jgi:uncharacterized protein YbjT (DUF2867 family)
MILGMPLGIATLIGGTGLPFVSGSATGTRENFERVDRDAVVAFAEIAKAHDAKSLTLVSATGAAAGSMFFSQSRQGPD